MIYVKKKKVEKLNRFRVKKIGNSLLWVAAEVLF